MTALQRDRRVLQAKERRLKELLVNAAQHGYDTQPHVLDEIDALEQEIGNTFELSTNEAYRLMYQQVFRLDGDLSNVRKEIALLQNSVTDLQKTLNAVLVALVGTSGSKATR